MPHQKPKTILLVEDELLIAIHTASILESFGYEVVTTHSGEDAVKLATETETISLVLMDINLGRGMDGTEAAKQILAVRHIPIVFLTSHMEEEYVAKVKEITRYGYVIKNSGNFVLKSSIEMAFELFKQHQKTRESEERYRTYINHAPEGIFITNASGQYIDVNPSACQMTGYSREELLSFSIPDLDVTDQRTEDIPTFDDLKATGSIETERVLQCKDGSRIHVLLNGVRISGERYIAFCTDITERKKAEDALKESVEVMRYIIKYDPNAIAVYDRDLRYIAVSDRYLADYNVTDRDILGKHHYEVFPEMPQRWKDIHKRVLQGNIERNDNDYFERPDGSITYNRWECRPWYKADGTIGGMITYTEVTTDRKLAEKALRESEQKYRMLFETANDAIFVADGQTGLILEVNKKAEELTGRSKAELIGKNQTQLHPGFQKEYASASFQDDVDRRGKTVYKEFHVIHQDGHTIPVEISPSIIDIEGRLYVYGLFRDVSDRKQAEQARQESLERFQAIFEQAAAGIAIAVPNEKVLDINEKFYEILGYTNEELLNLSMEEVTHPDDLDQELEYTREVVEGKRSYFNLEKRFIHKEGHIIWANVSSNVVRDEDGHIKFVIGVIVDITERKRAEQALQKSKRELQEANDTKDKFFSIIAHDLRNQLIAFGAGTDILKKQLQDSDDAYAKKVADELRTKAENLSELLENLLQWSRMQRGKMPYKPGKTDLYYPVTYIIDLLETNAQQKNITLTCLIRKTTFVYADYDMLLAVFRNLISNAIKYTKNGGVIRVDAQDKGDFVEVAVMDNGVGISEKRIANLFEVDDKRSSTFGTANEKGTGLGLILCKEFIEKHGGQIWVESEEGQGSRFRFTLSSGV